jgi:hypothetical protein
MIKGWQGALGVLALVGTAALGAEALQKTRSEQTTAEFVDQRIREWRPKPSERRFDEIGWAQDIRAAMRLAKAHHRPVFLFTMDGRINIGRC